MSEEAGDACVALSAEAGADFGERSTEHDFDIHVDTPKAGRTHS
jgi:hypothetical protein